jgi:hypothetical protein
MGGKTISEANDQIWVVSAKLIGRAEKTVKNFVWKIFCERIFNAIDFRYSDRAQ